MQKKTLVEIEKKYGKGSILFGSEVGSAKKSISTGSLGLDFATGIGGFALGTIVELRGWQSSGKSTIALNVIANAQKQGLQCLLVDAEMSYDRTYATALGIDTDKLLTIQMDYEGAEKCYNISEDLMRSGEVGVIVFDSQTALIPKKMVEDPVGTASMALQARMLSGLLPKFVAIAGHSNCLLLFITQYREKPGTMYGSPVRPTGGNALLFYSHMVVEVSKQVQKEGDVPHHNKTTCKISKNKLAAPYRTAEFDLIFGHGIDRQGEIINLAIEKNLITKSGSWYYYKDQNLGQGKESLKEYPEILEKLEKQILEQA